MGLYSVAYCTKYGAMRKRMTASPVENLFYMPPLGNANLVVADMNAGDRPDQLQWHKFKSQSRQKYIYVYVYYMHVRTCQLNSETVHQISSTGRPCNRVFQLTVSSCEIRQRIVTFFFSHYLLHHGYVIGKCGHSETNHAFCYTKKQVIRYVWAKALLWVMSQGVEWTTVGLELEGHFT